MKTVLLIVSVLFLTACSKGDERLKEKTKLESESQLSVENNNLAQKAQAMEKDLARRHRFYQAVKGIYEGTITTDIGTFNIRISLTPSLAPLYINRVRQLDEIASDLNGLTLNTQVVQWDPNNSSASVGCPGTAVKPDIEKGEIVIPSSDACKNLYIIKVTDRGFFGNSFENSNMATNVARQVLNGDLFEIDSLTGSIQPSSNSSIYKFTANKIQE